jgi:addiction module HigA family antidote
MKMALLQNPVHPGEVLQELYLVPLEMSAIDLAKRIGVPRTRVERLVKGTTGVTPDTALRFARVFNTSAEYWLNLQAQHDLFKVAANDDIAIELNTILPLAG